MLAGSVLSLLLIDRVGRRPLLLVSLGVASLSCLGLGFARSESTIILSSGGLATAILAAWPVVLGYTAELYPTRVRAGAAGWAVAVSRVGGIASPMLLSGLLSSWGGSLTAAMGVYAALLVAAVALVAVLGEETSGRTLEELSG
jgi:putative MFS transporter